MTPLRITTALAFALAFHTMGRDLGMELTVATIGQIGIGYCTIIGLALGCYTANRIKR